MADDINNPVPGTVPEPAPAAPSGEQPAAQPASPAPAAPAAPEPTSPRTQEQFEKLLEYNKRLAESNEMYKQELAQRTQVNEQLAPIQQPPAPQAKTEEDFIDVDPYTGERVFDEQKFKEWRSGLEEKVGKGEKAEQAVQNYIQALEQKEIDRQNREAFEVYPELNPDGDKFNVELHKKTRALLYDSLINPADYGNRPLTFKEAADTVRASEKTGESQPAPEVKTEEGGEETPSEAGQAKEQAAVAPAGQPPESREPVGDEGNFKQLVDATRGKHVPGLTSDEALAIRLKGTDHLGKPASSAEEEQAP